MNEPIPLYKWFPEVLEYATLVYTLIVVLFVIIKKIRPYDLIISILAIVLIGTSLFRLMSWGRSVVDSDRSLHYLTYIFGIFLIDLIYYKIKKYNLIRGR